MFDPKVTVRVERYHWGILRVVRVGDSYSIVVHPEHWALIMSQDSGSFVDEQGCLVLFEYRDPYTLRLTAHGHSVLVDVDNLDEEAPATTEATLES